MVGTGHSQVMRSLQALLGPPKGGWRGLGLVWPQLTWPSSGLSLLICLTKRLGKVVSRGSDQLH